MSHYGHAVICPAASTTPFGGNAVCHFIPSVTGTITINKLSETGSTVAVATGLVVTAGIWLNLSFYVSHLGGTIVTDTAAGVLVTS